MIYLNHGTGTKLKKTGEREMKSELIKRAESLLKTKSLPDDYAWHNGGLYHRGGDTLLPHHSGNWAWLENCDESEAAERAAEWEAQK